MCPLDVYLLRRACYKLQDLFSPPAPAIPEGQRAVVALPAAGRMVSLETALNSRCCSDNDGNPQRFHWGMFDGRGTLAPEVISEVVSRVKSVPCLNAGSVDVRVKEDVLTFFVENGASGPRRERLMVESGMQQQTVGLLCAALGVGMVYRSLGDEGVAASDADWATTRIRLGAMKPSYAGGYWTAQAPADSRPWLPGNLPDPVRDGQKALLTVLEGLTSSNDSGRTGSHLETSQLLWAARGRTPHFYKSEPWGMTIPTSRGQQDLSSVYVLSDRRPFRYVNWLANRPTHSLAPLENQGGSPVGEPPGFSRGSKTMMVFATNVAEARALWEVGFQLLNVLAQASALDLIYRATFLEGDQKAWFTRAGISNPVAAVLI